MTVQKIFLLATVLVLTSCVSTTKIILAESVSEFLSNLSQKYESNPDTDQQTASEDLKLIDAYLDAKSGLTRKERLSLLNKKYDILSEKFPDGPYSNHLETMLSIQKLAAKNTDLLTSVQIELARLYFTQEEYQKSIEICKKNYKDSDTIQEKMKMYILAASYYKMGDLDEAKKYANKSMNASKTNSLPLELLNAIYKHQNEFKKRIDALNRLNTELEYYNYYTMQMDYLRSNKIHDDPFVEPNFSDIILHQPWISSFSGVNYPMPILTAAPHISNECRTKENLQIAIAFDLTPDGIPDRIKVKFATEKCLFEPAIKAVQSYRYEPKIVSGTPKPQYNIVEIVRTAPPPTQ